MGTPDRKTHVHCLVELSVPNNILIQTSNVNKLLPVCVCVSNIANISLYLFKHIF